jgi:hypothetical protein
MNNMEVSDSYTRNNLLKDYAAIIDKSREESEKIEQILGKALKYPWFKDDPKNFPTATEEDGVCVGDHTAWSLSMSAADRIKELEEELVRWKACAENLVEYAHEYVAHLSSWGKGYDRVDKEIKQAEDAIEEYVKLKNS